MNKRYVFYCPTAQNFSEPQVMPVDRALVDPAVPARTVVFPIPAGEGHPAVYPYPVPMPEYVIPGAVSPVPVPVAEADGRAAMSDLNKTMLWIGGTGLAAAGLGWLGNRLAHSAGGGL